MPLLSVDNLCTSFFTDSGEIKAVNGVSFELEKGQILGIVGESGSGKSVTAYSIMQILPSTGRIVGGSIKFNSTELTGADEKTLRCIRGNRISIVFQDPMTSLNPTYTIGNQLTEAILLHFDISKAEAYNKAVELLEMVSINDPKKRMKQYPHELSGGMRQRVMIAMALSGEPDILIADEPTTALDVTIQADILNLIKKLSVDLGMAVIMITHDLGVVAEMCDDVIVMYAGTVCEKGTVNDIFCNPQHEYTKGLLQSVPSASDIKAPLKPIQGTPVDLLNMPKGCPFAPRCKAAMKICLKKRPDKIGVSQNHYTSCWMYVKTVGSGVDSEKFNYNGDNK